MNRFQSALLTILQKLFPPERPSESELIAIGYQQALADLARKEKQQLAIYEQPAPERHTDPIEKLPVQTVYRPGQRLKAYRLSRLETERVPIIRLKKEKQ